MRLRFDRGTKSDGLFSGNFAPAGALSATGFDKLGAYGNTGGGRRWLLDFDHDGVPDHNVASGVNVDGVPVAGDFVAAHPGDEIGLFTGSKWYLDSNANNNIEVTDLSLSGTLKGGVPIVGDFDGDDHDDLGVWQSGGFSFDLFALNGGLNGNIERTINFGFAGPIERPIAADFNADGIDDIGLFVTQHGGVTPSDAAEWFVLISTGAPIAGEVNTLNHAFEPAPFGNDLYALFGNAAGQPLVGNFDPPTSFATAITDPDTNPGDPLDVDNDGFVTASDVLTIINYINAGTVAQAAATSFTSASFPDVDGNQHITASDVIMVINYINSRPDITSEMGAESEANDAYFDSFGSDPNASDELWSLLASDAESSSRRRR